jgi:hypothetical protein
MAEDVSPDIEVAEFAGQLFFRLWRASHTRTAQPLDSVGLTTTTFAVLNVLGAREGTIQQQLSADMGIDPSAMVKLINTLEEGGLVEAATTAERPPRLGGKDHAKRSTRTPASKTAGLRRRRRDSRRVDRHGASTARCALRQALATGPQPGWRADGED